MKNKYKMRYILNITCYKTVPKAVEYEGKLKKRGGSQANASLAKFAHVGGRIRAAVRRS